MAARCGRRPAGPMAAGERANRAMASLDLAVIELADPPGCGEGVGGLSRAADTYPRPYPAVTPRHPGTEGRIDRTARKHTTPRKHTSHPALRRENSCMSGGEGVFYRSF